MTLFKGFFSSSPSQKDSGRDLLQNGSSQSRGLETMHVKTNLQERMAFRRELLFETIRATLNMRFIAPNT